MKKIVISIITILMVTSGVIAYTITQYSDTQNGTGEVLVAATLNLTVDGQDGFTIAGSGYGELLDQLYLRV